MATVAPAPSSSRQRASAAAPATVADGDVRWVVSGVAGELARRLHASVLFIRVLFVIVGFALIWPVIGVYGAAALLLPQGDRRLPGWRNVVGLSRLGFLLLGIVALRGLSLDGSGVIGQGPSVWIPCGAAVLAGVTALFGTGRWAAESSDKRDRRLVIMSIPAVALAAIIAIGMIVVPAVRWELVLDLGLVALGVWLAWAARHDASALPVIPYLALALLAIVLAGSGARLQGGVGELRAAPRGLAPRHVAYRRAIGDETVDLSALRGAGRTASVDASVGIGNLTITLPADADGRVDVRVGSGGWVGEYGGRGPSSGFDLRTVLPVFPVGHPTPPASSLLHLQIEADVGRGCVTVLVAGYGFQGSGGCS